MLDMPNYNIKLDSNYIVLYHNTTSKNIDSIIKNGIKATAGKTQGRGLDGDFVWATSTPNLKGYGGNTVAFKIKKDIAEQYKVNSDEYTIPFDIPASDILFIDRYIVDNYRLSDIPNIVNKFGKDKVIKVYTNRQDKFVNGYTLQDLINIIDSLKTTKTESRTKIEEASRNELLVKAKSQTITRYKKSAGYKGFSIIDIDTTSVFTTNSLRVTCRVGDYWDTVEMQNILYWIQLEAEKNSNYQINTKGITAAIMNSIDGMDIKVDCTCADFCLEENTKIKLLNNNIVTIKQLKEMFDNNEEIWVYSTDEYGDFKPGKVNNVWISGKSKEMVKVTLDNGKYIITTPNHKYMMRDGSYKEASELKEKDSLMALYFSYHNGYENVKRNSIVYPTKFDSVYKQVANNILQNEIEAAKDRTGENVIQIHHKDFNKLNNYPSNLYPMGKIEHWMYHAKLGGVVNKNFIEAGRKFWVSDPRRFEALKKQKKRASICKKEWWAKMTPEQRHQWALQHSWVCTPQGKEILSHKLKDVWNNYTSEQKENRLNTSNTFRLNNPMNNPEFLNSPKMLQRNAKISLSLHKFIEDTTEEQRSQLYGWAKGIKQSEETINKRRESLKRYHQNHTISEETRQRLQEAGIRQAEQNKLSRCKRNIEELIKNNIPITEETFYNNRKNGDPHWSKVFNTFEEMLKYYDVPIELYNHKVVKVEFIQYQEPINVYDLEVDKYHNFYVDAGVMLHNCYRFAYMATKLKYKYGKPENRPAKITNPHDYGSMCKHLISMLSNKKWLQQTTGTVMDFIVDRIDDVNKYLRPNKGEELTLPNELARQNAKAGFYSKLFKDKQEQNEPTQDEEQDNENVQDESTNNNEITQQNNSQQDNNNNEEENV